MWRREDELARITGKWMQWDLLGGTCCWPDSVSTQFFSLGFFFLLSNANGVSLYVSSLRFFPLLTGDSISLSSLPSFQLSKWTNQSSLTSLFFLLSRSPRALSFLVSVASPSSPSSSAFFPSSQTLLCTHQSIPFEFFFLSLPILLSMSPTSHKKTRARANAVDERPERARE